MGARRWARGIATTAGGTLALALGAPAAAASATATSAVGPPSGRARLDLVLPLVADDAGLARFARAVSTPGSALYGRYQPIAMLAGRYGARPAVRARVLRYLHGDGVRTADINATGMFAEVTVTVGAAERLFGVSLARFRAADGERFIAPVRSGHESAAGARVPAALRGLVTGVIGLDTRRVVGSPQRRHAAFRRQLRAHAGAAQPASGYLPPSGTPAGCGAGVASGGFTPNQYLSAYDYTPLRKAGLGGRGERVALIEVDGFKYSDLRTFARCFGLDVPRLSVFFVGSPHGLPAGGETTLDLEVLDAVAPHLDSIEVYENGGDAVSVFKSFVLPLIAPGAKPQVVSASLGLCEQFLSSDFGRPQINSIQRDMELATATGITLLASSGDTVSAGCTQGRGHVVDQLNVSYPASSEWVTGVGGTNVFLWPSNAIGAQVVWNDTSAQLGGGGGGLSELFGRPPYQAGVVAQRRRAVPDVSMLADPAPGYAIYCTAPADPLCANGPPWHTVGGTSAAAPLLAGGVALVNQDLRRHQREFLGLMNPLLYAIGRSSIHAHVFDDVTQINNDVGAYIPGGNGLPLGCCRAGPGYDDASGWGSVDLAGLDRVALQVLPRYGNVAISIPRPQKPIWKRALKVRLFCSAKCAAYVFAVVTIGTQSAFTAKSATHRFRRKGAKLIPIRFSAGQLRRMRSGLAKHRKVEAEAFAVALDTRGQIAKVTPGRVVTIRD